MKATDGVKLFTDLCDVLLGDEMPSYRLMPLRRLLQLTCEECQQHVNSATIPLMLRQISTRIVSLNSLLQEIEDVYACLGWFEFTSRKYVLCMIVCDI